MRVSSLEVADVIWAYSYLRFSSDAQADGDSIRRQTSLLDRWLARHPHVRLDDSLRMVARGVSAFTDRHRKDLRHPLAQFLDLVRRQRVPVGSYLIVENLDRLTRENPLDSIQTVLQELIRAGIRIVTLEPEALYDSTMGFGQLMMLLWELFRGHAESQRKSDLLGAVWAEKKRQARADKKPHGCRVPEWLELTREGYRVREPAGGTIRQMLRWSAEGLGRYAIYQRLLKECVPAIARSGRWTLRYVGRILDNRAVIGEYQPMKGGRQRVPDGEPIPSYFPAAATETEWYAAHAAKTARQRRSGRPGQAPALHLFSGLLWCARDRCSLHVHANRHGRKHLLSSRARNSEPGAHWEPFPLAEFTDCLRSKLSELQATELFQDPDGARLQEIKERLRDARRLKEIAVAQFEADRESRTWQELVSKYDREERALVREEKAAGQKASHPQTEKWAEAVTLLAEQEPERLRAAFLQTIDSIWCLFVNRGTVRFAAVQVWFRDSDQHRDYALCCWAQRGPRRSHPAPAPECWALADLVKLGPLDFRKPASARKIEAALKSVSLCGLKPPAS